MNILNSKPVAYAAGVIAAGVVLVWIASRLKGEAGAALAKVGEAVNPTSDKNVAYRGVNAIGATVTGDKSFSLGGWLYGVINGEYDPNASKTGKPAYLSGADQTASNKPYQGGTSVLAVIGREDAKPDPNFAAKLLPTF